ncbi:3'(2'),5'-bisphosphate nucleotidase CysQ [uncultured Roseobacter sp.]|uniref:3'(2'),5'-bisphosphate nucleotidase CysQ n=1 Tax=uncultured Roseobacter sp. TaxID=114847 RepID=UPI00262F2D33|nr:3'(2'),5'-bisphosphate nucleotidase CysQ [uncultured Roseobacter sp.]
MQGTDLALISDAVRVAGRVATSFTGGSARRWDKPGGAGPVTEADLAVNSYLETVLRAARPDYGWLSEETEDNAERLGQDTVFIVDPIDGTRSFVEGSRTWAHSVAVVHQGKVTAGAVCLPLRDRLYTAALGGGAFLNGNPIAASPRNDPGDADILATKPVMDASHWSGAIPAFRRAHRPSLAYRLSLVGEGRFDAMLTFRAAWEWDIAAGALIVTEAGGICSDRKGRPLRFNNPAPRLDGVVAAGPAMHPGLMRALQG